MVLLFMQTLQHKKSFKGMNIENCLVRPNFGETHQAKNYPNVSKIGNIDGADKYTKIDIMDIISNILLLFSGRWLSFKEDTCRWQ